MNYNSKAFEKIVGQNQVEDEAEVFRVYILIRENKKNWKRKKKIIHKKN